MSLEQNVKHNEFNNNLELPQQLIELNFVQNSAALFAGCHSLNVTERSSWRVVQDPLGERCNSCANTGLLSSASCSVAGNTNRV